jgi:hypothetical protein
MEIAAIPRRDDGNVSMVDARLVKGPATRRRGAAGFGGGGIVTFLRFPGQWKTGWRNDYFPLFHSIQEPKH